MAASRKLYRDIAESIQADMIGMSPRQAAAASEIARGVAYALKRDNSAFRYDRFFDACGLDEFGFVIKGKKAIAFVIEDKS